MRQTSAPLKNLHRQAESSRGAHILGARYFRIKNLEKQPGIEKEIMKRPVCLIVALGWLCCIVSHAKQLDKKQGKFLSVEDPLKNEERKLISSSKSPSELSCSQKCLHHEKCKYKKFDSKTEQCDLLQSIAREDFQAKQKITKKETVQREVCVYFSINFAIKKFRK